MIPVFFAINNSYFPQVETTIVSILENSGEDFEFLILIDSPNSNSVEGLRNFVGKKYGKRALITIIDMHSCVPKIKKLIKADGRGPLPIETYFRLFIPQLSHYCSKVIYLDADLIVEDDLGKLFACDLKNCSLGAVVDPGIKKLVNEDAATPNWYKERTLQKYISDYLKVDPSRYFNAGVLLMDIEKIKKYKLDEEIFNVANKYSPFIYHDQDILNKVFADNVLPLDPRWNSFPFYRSGTFKDAESDVLYQKCNTEPKIIHYAGKSKPWRPQEMGQRFSTWWIYYMNTSFASLGDKDKLEELKRIEDKYAKYKKFFTVNLFNVKFHLFRENFSYRFMMNERCLLKRTIRVGDLFKKRFVN